MTKLFQQILNHLADVLYFGAMRPCSMCKEGQFEFKNAIYTCNGNISEWSKCINTVKAPNRVPAQIPDKYRTFLRGTFKVRTRILNDAPRIDDDEYEYVELKNIISMEPIHIRLNFNLILQIVCETAVVWHGLDDCW